MSNDSNSKPLTGGAIPSPQHVMDAAPKHLLIGDTPPQFLHFPKLLSKWGTDTYGCSVASEEAFNKACNNPEFFIPDSVVTNWADYNGYLHSASISSVLDTMQNYGFQWGELNYNNGTPRTVDFMTDESLQNAIANVGTVKLGVDDLDLSGFWSVFNGWFATDLPERQSQGFCISCCGYGTFEWLASQLGYHVPDGLDPNMAGYAIYYRGSIGVIDATSLKNITYEAWVRDPSTIVVNPVSVVFEAISGEEGKLLSHALDKVWLQDGYQGTGELFYIQQVSADCVALACGGGEQNSYLSHADQILGLMDGFSSYDTAWVIHQAGDNLINIECGPPNRGWFLSHAQGGLSFTNGVFGDGEVWRQTPKSDQ